MKVCSWQTPMLTKNLPAPGSCESPLEHDRQGGGGSAAHRVSGQSWYLILQVAILKQMGWRVVGRERKV